MDGNIPLKDAKTGRFVKGHPPSGGRPPGAVNVVTKSLREQVLQGFGDVPKFVSELKKEYPPAAAGLLARMMPNGDASEDGGNGTRVITIIINPVPSGFHKIEDADGNVKWFTTEEAAELYRASLPKMIDVTPEEAEPVIEAEVEAEVDTSNVTRLDPHNGYSKR